MQSHSYDRGLAREPDDRRASQSPVEPYPDRASVPADVEAAFDHPERVGHPDGVPHDIVGRTALGLVVTAAVGVLAWLMLGAIAAVLLGALALFLVFRGLPRRARRERTEEARVEAHTPHPPARVTDAPRGDANA
jgi:Flp pilus assembly protein TadB